MFSSHEEVECKFVLGGNQNNVSRKQKVNNLETIRTIKKKQGIVKISKQKNGLFDSEKVNPSFHQIIH